MLQYCILNYSSAKNREQQRKKESSVGLISGFVKKVKRIFAYDQVCGDTQFVVNSTKKMFQTESDAPKPEGLLDINMSLEERAQRKAQCKKTIYLCLAMLGLAFLYMLLLLKNSEYFSLLAAFGVCILIFAYMLRYGFYWFQLDKGKLGYGAKAYFSFLYRLLKHFLKGAKK